MHLQDYDVGSFENIPVPHCSECPRRSGLLIFAELLECVAAGSGLRFDLERLRNPRDHAVEADGDGQFHHLSIVEVLVQRMEGVVRINLPRACIIGVV